MKNFKISLIVFLFLLNVVAKATHNRAGEITYKQLDALTYEFTLTTYTDVSNQQNADRPEATLTFGDQTTSTAQRTNGPKDGTGRYLGEVLPFAPSFKKNVYIFTHSFPGQGSYTIGYMDQNRNAGVLNMANSIETAFYVEAYLVINPFIGFNTSPFLSIEPVDFGGLGKLFVHNPGAYDVDGDSLSYKLVPCKRDVFNEVTLFKYLTKENGFADTSFTIDSKTGDVIWRRPIKPGLYNIAILIEEWRYIKAKRRYINIGYVVRDMQIQIVDTENNPPTIHEPLDFCVIAGTKIDIPIFVKDIDLGDIIRVSAGGGPIYANPPAQFPQGFSKKDSFTVKFVWQTNCNLVRRQPYEIVFKAFDNGSPNLVDLKSMLITIVAPAPKNIMSQIQGLGINVQWDPEDCNKALGYKIYRKINSTTFNPNECITGLPVALGYTLIDTVLGTSSNTYFDNNKGRGLSPGNNYCYRIVAFFEDESESICSAETCNELSADRPSIINVSIINTDLNLGMDTIRWVHPKTLDTTLTDANQPPYKYELFRKGTSENNFTLIKSFSSNVLQGWKDTVYVDELLNTKEKQYEYRVKLYGNGIAGEYMLGESALAQSVFLTGSAFDKSILLKWESLVPWNIDSTNIFRFDVGLNQWIKIKTTDKDNYKDLGLTNGTTYRYYVQTIGKYSSTSFPKPLLNNSQEIFLDPIDSVPPCAPILDTVIANCEKIENSLSYFSENLDCNLDVYKYRIYRKIAGENDFILVKELEKSGNPTEEFIHNTDELKDNMAGCYYVTSIDTIGNESKRSNSICVDNCPNYKLPNVFTPNGDGKNDYFTAFPDSSRFNKSIDLHIYNRWGSKVYSSTDPDFKWDGRDNVTGVEVTSGVYFYVCDIFEVYLAGIKKRSIKGNVTLIK